MRPNFFLFAAALVLAASSAASRGDEPTTERTDPKLPNVPGPFHAYNVTGTTFKGRYHSQISQFGLEPMVMIFTREVDFSDALKGLLAQIDNVVEKNPTARLHPFVVVLSDDVPEVVGADDKTDDRRLEVVAQLEKQADAMKLQHIDVVLAGKADLAKYNLDKFGFAFYLFQRDKVTAKRELALNDKITDDVAKEILAALAEKAKAVRK